MDQQFKRPGAVRIRKERYIHEDGTVHKAVYKNLDGVEILKVDRQIHPDAAEYQRLYPDARLNSRSSKHGSTPRVVNPLQYSVRELEDTVLPSVDSLDTIRTMIRIDTRSSTERLYRNRVQEIMDAEYDTGDDTEDSEE